MENEVSTTRYRLLGIGVSNLAEVEGEDLADLIDRREAKAEHAIDKLRSKFGSDAVVNLADQDTSLAHDPRRDRHQPQLRANRRHGVLARKGAADALLVVRVGNDLRSRHWLRLPLPV